MSELRKRDFDVVVVGAGPNGLAAAIRLQQAGLSVIILEGERTVGGGARSSELTLPGFTHDICSAVHPLAVDSPYLRTLPLSAHGLEYIQPTYAAAHPFDDGHAAILKSSLDDTAQLLGDDKEAYLSLLRPLVEKWPRISDDILGPLRIPKDPVAYAQFGMKAITSARHLARKFVTKEARGLWAGMAAHSIQPLSNLATSAIALVLLITGHSRGWPIPRGGSQQIANALAAYFISLGGKIETGFYVTRMDQLPASHAVIFDLMPRQVLQIAGHKFSALYRWQLNRYRYGMGVFKVDWALGASVPFMAEDCRKAGTVHLGNTFEEIAGYERGIWSGHHGKKPFVLFAQPSVFDSSRAPEGKHTGWAYCHVPAGSTVDMTDAIESQVERFAPGFRDTILARHTYNAVEMEGYNRNYVGGDITGGVNDVGQIFTRPAVRMSPYGTSAKGIYICSAATPPGGGVHGLCGVHAANKAMRDVFPAKARQIFNT
jgi:phytoene dehydrogenase-like protein